MNALPLRDFFDELRTEGFAVGVDDHVRVQRVIAIDTDWDAPKLRTALRAIFAKDPASCRAFDSVFDRFFGNDGPRVSIPPPSSIALSAGRSPPSASEATSRHGTRGQRVVRGIVLVLLIAGIGVGARLWWKQTHTTPPVTASSSAERNQPSFLGSSASASPSPATTYTVTLSVAPLESIAAPTSPIATPPAPPPEPKASAIRRLVEAVPRWLAALALAIGLLAMVGATTIAARKRQRRLQFVPGPFRMRLALPHDREPTFSHDRIEDAAIDLSFRPESELAAEVDVERSVLRTVAAGGYPTLAQKPPPPTPRYVMLIDDGPSTRGWRWQYEELARALSAAGVRIDVHDFATDPRVSTPRDGARKPVTLEALAERADALLIVGDAEAGIDPGDGTVAPWVEELARFSRRLWLNPLPPARWSVGARVVARSTPMEHGTTSALAAMRPDAFRLRRDGKQRQWAPVIDVSPSSSVALAALREHLGSAFPWLAACAVADEPSVDIARWLLPFVEPRPSESDRLHLLTLPWLSRRRFPEGLREALLQWLATEDPALLTRARRAMVQLIEANEPPMHSVAHLQWRVARATQGAALGDRPATDALMALVDSPVSFEASQAMRSVGVPDRTRRPVVVLAAIAAFTLGASGTLFTARRAIGSAPKSLATQVAAANAANAPWTDDVSIGTRSDVLAVAYSSDGSRLVTGGSDATVRLWDAKSGALIMLLSAHSGAVRTVSFSRDGTRVLSAGDDGRAKLWDTTSGRLLLSLEHDAPVRAAVLTADRARIATASGKQVRWWNAQTGALLQNLRTRGDALSVAVPPNGRYLLVVDGTKVTIYDSTPDAQTATVDLGQALSVERATYSADGSQLLFWGTGSPTVSLRSGSMQGYSAWLSLRGHTGGITAAAWSPDGKRVLSASLDGTLRAWLVATDASQSMETPEVLRAFAWSPDGGTVVAVGDSGKVRFFHPHLVDDGTGAVRAVEPAPSTKPSSVPTEVPSTKKYPPMPTSGTPSFGGGKSKKPSVWSGSGPGKGTGTGTSLGTGSPMPTEQSKAAPPSTGTSYAPTKKQIEQK